MNNATNTSRDELIIAVTPYVGPFGHLLAEMAELAMSPGPRLTQGPRP